MARSWSGLIIFGLAVASPVLPLATAIAGADSKTGKGGYVVACSRFGNGCYKAPVRKSAFGPQMRLKGGTWIDCRGDCRETLREETVDFWETQNDKATIASP